MRAAQAHRPTVTTSIPFIEPVVDDSIQRLLRHAMQKERLVHILSHRIGMVAHEAYMRGLLQRTPGADAPWPEWTVA